MSTFLGTIKEIRLLGCGMMVKISEHGFVSFLHLDKDDQELELNWKRLHQIVMPIINFQFLKIAIDGNWKTKPVHISLESMMLDNSVVQFDAGSYHCMEKSKDKDLKECKEAWNKKIVGELMKDRITKICKREYVKGSKTGHHLVDLHCMDGSKENKETKKNRSENQQEPVSSNVISAEKERVGEGGGDKCVHLL
jgi:hypothetical protein